MIKVTEKEESIEIVFQGEPNLLENYGSYMVARIVDVQEECGDDNDGALVEFGTGDVNEGDNVPFYFSASKETADAFRKLADFVEKKIEEKKENEDENVST